MDNKKNNKLRGHRYSNPIAILAYGRHETVYYESMLEAMLLYEILSTSMLERMIESGQVWKGDGYTTFDYALK